jgi:predicted kinase
MNVSKKLIIFEGVDGVGKTTLSRIAAAELGARYVHLGPFPGVTDGLARLYVEAMMPAVLGHADVVLDRSWLSEPIYGAVYRDGADRIGLNQRALERLAWRCETLVIRCDATWSAVAKGFRQRRGAEYLATEDQLKAVWERYENRLATSLVWVTCRPLERETADAAHWVRQQVEAFASRPHALDTPSAGNQTGGVLLVGEAFGAHGEGDPLYRWPFGGLTGRGCSRWLAQQLADAGIDESYLAWVNADQLTARFLDLYRDTPVVALGDQAARALAAYGRNCHVVPHPQAWKFNHGSVYPLVPLLQELLV